MSQKYYIDKWQTAQEDLNSVISLERPDKPEPLAKTLTEAFERVCLRYVKYISVYKRLIKCYDCMVHPQRRLLIARCIEGVTGRIVELRHELFRISICEYSGFGPFCLAFRILPSDLEMTLSHSYESEKEKRLKNRQDLFKSVQDSAPASSDTEFRYDSPIPKKSKFHYDSRIQSRTHSMNELLMLEWEEGTSIIVSKGAIGKSKMSPAFQEKQRSRDKLHFGRQSSIWKPNQKRKVVNWKKVQYVFKVFQARLLVDSVRQNTDIVYNMLFKGISRQQLEETEMKVVTKRIATARDNEDYYNHKLHEATESLKKSRMALNTEQDVRNNFRQWVLECRDATGVFPDLPGVELGGLTAIFALKTPEQVKEELDNADDKALKAKPKPKPKASEKKSKKPEVLEGFLMKNSVFIDESLVPAMCEYETIWRDRDDRDNFKQTMNMNLLNEHVQSKVEETLREKLDEQMRNELQFMITAVEKQKAAKVKVKKPKKDKKLKKKEKKKKTLKDLTPNAHVDDLYLELVRNNIVKQPKNVKLRDFLGEMNLVSEEENKGEECKPDLGDVRKMMFDYVVLPMSSQAVHEKAPVIKSLLLAGPTGCGKNMLVQAACNELGANLFDLTAQNIKGKYREPQDQQMLMHLVMKVGKLLEPSIILIDDCDLMFTKKLPPEIDSNPGRMKSNLTKAMKTIGPEDRIMLIGTTSRPYRAAKKPFLKMYERIIMMKPPCYAARYAIWESKILSSGGHINRPLIISTLAHISRNFTVQSLTDTVKSTLTPKRIYYQKCRTLHTCEFGEKLAKHTPVHSDELQALTDWMMETPLFKKRRIIRELIEAGKPIFELL